MRVCHHADERLEAQRKRYDLFSESTGDLSIGRQNTSEASQQSGFSALYQTTGVAREM